MGKWRTSKGFIETKKIITIYKIKGMGNMPKKKELLSTNELDSLRNDLLKKYGSGTIAFGGNNSGGNIQRWIIDSPKISNAFGGGLPKGRHIEVFGDESTGKTSLMCYLAGQIQKAGGIIAYIDMEHALDHEYAETFGLDMSEVLFAQPDSGEQALGIVEDLVKSKQVDFIVIDSVAALTPQAEIEGEMSDQQMGAQARLMGKAMRKITPIMKEKGVSIGWVNQTRMKIGVMFGSPLTTSGGQALKFYSSIRIQTYKKAILEKGEEIYGMEMRIKVVKNKVGKPNAKHELIINFGEGFDVLAEYIDYAVDNKIVNKAGSWYSYKDEKIGQGRKNACEYLKDNLEIYEEIKTKVNTILFPKAVKEKKEDKNA